METIVAPFLDLILIEDGLILHDTMSRESITLKSLSVYLKKNEIFSFIEIFMDIQENKNAFMYGWEYGIFEFDSRAKNAWIRLFPSLLSQKNNWFNFKDCSFKWEKAKEETARIVWFKEIDIRHSFTLEWSFYGREKIEGEEWDLHMEVPDFKQLGEDFGRTFINFLPLPKYKSKLNFLYRKFLNIIHEEALKWCLPFNRDRYLKRNYKDESAEQFSALNIQEEIPSLDDIEGFQLQPELDDISLNSHDEDENDNNIEIHSKEINLNESQNAYKTNLNLTKEDSNKQPKLQLEETEEFHEFDNLLSCIEQFEHERAIQSSSDSNKDDSDSDDEDANLIK